jgi:hypothetical protein
MSCKRELNLTCRLIDSTQDMCGRLEAALDFEVPKRSPIECSWAELLGGPLFHWQCLKGRSGPGDVIRLTDLTTARTPILSRRERHH